MAIKSHKKRSAKKIVRKQLVSKRRVLKKSSRKSASRKSSSRKSSARKSSSRKSSARKSSSRKSSARKSSSRKSSSRKSSARKSSSRKSSARKSSSRKSSSRRSSARKTRVKSHYRMRGMGNLLQMYGGASSELEAEHNACLVKYKQLIDSHAEVKKSTDDLRLSGASKDTINEQVSKANDIREQIKDLIDGADKCKEKQAALLETLKEVTHNVTEQLNNEIEQSGGNAAEIGAKLDAFGLSTKAKAQEVGVKLSNRLKSIGSSINQKYNDYKDKKSLQKRAVDLSSCEKNFTKDELSSGSISV